jgi:orotidine-5'-phosphate decarboxylase
MNDARSRLIVALDLPDQVAALSAVDRLAGHVGYFKLGLEIFVREGPRLVEEIAQRGEKIFLDLKLHDIPNTVSAAVRSACRLGIHMLTIHAAGGLKMLEAASWSAEASASPPLLLAVSALTSLSPEDIQALGIKEPLSDWVMRLADLAYQAGIPGLVTSSLELPLLKAKFGGRLRFVVPGIRPQGTAVHDQSRIASPAEAIRAGANFLVVGRPILQSPNPAHAADHIVAEIDTALQAITQP